MDVPSDGGSTTGVAGSSGPRVRLAAGGGAGAGAGGGEEGRAPSSVGGGGGRAGAAAAGAPHSTDVVDIKMQHDGIHGAHSTGHEVRRGTFKAARLW